MPANSVAKETTSLVTGLGTFVSLCLDPAESLPLSRKMRRRIQGRTIGVGRKGGREGTKGRQRDGEL